MPTLRELQTDYADVAEVMFVGDPRMPVEQLNHLIFSPHSRRLYRDMGDIEIPHRASEPMRNFLKSPPGKLVQAYGDLRADTGAREIGINIMDKFAEKEESAMMIGPKIVGRGVLDLNRPTETCLDLAVPKYIEKQLLEIHRRSMELLFGVFERSRASLKSVIQPHTMASGTMTEEEGRRFEVLNKKIRGNANECAYNDPKAVQADIEELSALYDAMNNRRQRLNVNIVRGIPTMGPNGPMKAEDGSPIITPIPDVHNTAHKFRIILRDMGIRAEFDNPFPHAPEYPGSELAKLAGEARIPQLTCDIPRFMLQRNPDAHVNTLTFDPDRFAIRGFGTSIVGALAFPN